MIFDIWVFLKNLSRKFKFHWNHTWVTSTLYKDQYIFLIVSRSVLGIRYVSEKGCRENLKTHIMLKHFFFLSCVVYKLMWKTLTKLRLLASRVRPTVCLSVPVQQLKKYWLFFHVIWWWVCTKIYRRVKFLKLGKSVGRFVWGPTRISERIISVITQLFVET